MTESFVEVLILLVRHMTWLSRPSRDKLQALLLAKNPGRTNNKHHRRAMNCRSEALEVTVEARQVEEAMLALLHTILLHRSTGKFHYKKEGTYSIGTVGTQDIDCDFIDFTFVRVSSEELDRAIRRAVSEFKVQNGLRLLIEPTQS